MTRTRYRYLGTDAPYFLTLTVNNWLPLFTRPETVDILLDGWRYLRDNHAFTLHGYVILENHLHLVAHSPELPKDMQRFKSYSAKRLLEVLETHQAERLLRMLALFKRRYKTASIYQVWEEGSHPQRIESEEVMRQKLDYIHYNPVKRGYVDLPEHWRWSSARNYAGGPGLIEVDTAWL
jgi:REP element-mobilizing transposase RayT